LHPHEPGHPRWYVFQNRPGLFQPADRWLLRHGRASHVRQCQGVPLVWVFPFEELERAIRETTGGDEL
jgi:hypothetical protein